MYMSDYHYYMSRQESTLLDCHRILGLNEKSPNSLSIIEKIARDRKNIDVLEILENAGLIYTHGGV